MTIHQIHENTMSYVELFKFLEILERVQKLDF